jgi:hypothetical protein
MTKIKKNNRRSGRSNNNNNDPKETAKAPPNRVTQQVKNRTATAPTKEKKAPTIVVDSPHVDADVKQSPKVDDYTFHLDITSNNENQEVISCPLGIPLSKLFSKLDKSSKEEIQGYGFKDRAFESEDDKSLEGHLKRGARLIENAQPTSKEWFKLFTQAYTDETYEGPVGTEMRDLAMNLAASDPLELFAPEELDIEGNLFHGPLPPAWLAATLVHGSVHLFYDLEIHANRMHALTFEDVHDDNDRYLVCFEGTPAASWFNLTEAEKQEANAFTRPQRFGEDAKDRCLQDTIESFSKQMKTKEKNMTIKKWRSAFSDSITKGSLVHSSRIGQQLRALGVDLALANPRHLFLAHEWLSAEYLRPQSHSIVWLAAVAVFGSLWSHHDTLLAEVVDDMHTSDEEDTPAPVAEEIASSASEMDDASVQSEATAVAGTDRLQEQKLKGQYRKHHLRYDLRLHVPASQEADKVMIAAAKKFFAKAKEMDPTITVLPWSATSSQAKLKDARSIPEQMGAFKMYFHQAQPKVAGGHVYMRVWLAHDKEPELLQEDLRWWMQNQQFGLYPRSVQAENISGVGWLLYSTKEVNCTALKDAIEKRLGNKYEIGCRFKMISLGVRGAVAKENQVKAIHIECDSADQFDVKVALSKIYASEKNDDYPNGIRLRLVPEINSMIAPDTRQSVSRLRARQDNFQKKVATCISWDIDALDFVDHRLGRSLRDLIMKIESRTVIGQPLFHVVDQTWNKNGFVFVFFPNVDAEARTMMMSLIPFLRHHYQESITKWFSSTSQLRAQGAEWDPDKGCVKTFEDEAVAWMMKEDGFSSFDVPLAATTTDAARPDPSNLQLAAGATGLIDDQDSVGTFNPQNPGATAPTGPPAQLVTGSKANSQPRTLPAQTGSDQQKSSFSADAGSVGSSSTRSSMTKSIISRMSQIEGSMAKVAQLESMMSLIAAKMGLLADPAPASIIPPTPTNAPPATVSIVSAPAAPASQLDQVSQSTPATVASPVRHDGVRPLTHEGTPSSPRALHEIRQSPTDTASADVSKTDVGRAG